MKPFKRIAALTTVLQHRSNVVQAHIARERQALAAIDQEIDLHAQAIARLREELAATLAPSGVLRRTELMRVRGKQAVGRFQIACRQLDIAELEDSRQQARQALAVAQEQAMALVHRQRKHQTWLHGIRTQHQLEQERRVEVETMERVGNEYDR
ncbi:BsaT protein [Burkholderia ubonensis]|uniref:BsaT protein n=1 Tax=Burkholderia ubonensis TaxID=101571 RepID=UPI000B23F235|nr:BsaT protein [Burkholderia ubonensis]